MQLHNFLRNAIPDLEKKYLKAIEIESPVTARAMRDILNTAKLESTQKFILPNTGRILDDDMKAVPSVLRLPFPVIEIEYTCITNSIGLPEQELGKERTERAVKRIIIAKEYEEYIAVFSIVKYEYSSNKDDIWVFFPYCAVLAKNNPEKAFKVTSVGDDIEYVKSLHPEWERMASLDLMDESRAVVEFIEALSCSNIGFSERYSSNPSGKKLKKNIGFDSYRVLSINATGNKENLKFEPETNVSNGRASPREHVRRGHIRTYASGLKIWINNVIVNANIGSKVVKTYSIK